MGENFIPKDKKIQTVAIIAIVIIVLCFFIKYNIPGENQPESTANGTSVAAKGETTGSSKQSGSVAKQSADNQDISIFEDEFAIWEQSIFAAEQSASQRGTASAAGQRLSQTGSILTSEQAVAALQQGTISAAEWLALQQGQSISIGGQTFQLEGYSGNTGGTSGAASAAGQRLSQTGSILTSDHAAAALQQGTISTAEWLALQQGQSISIGGQTFQLERYGGNTGTTSTTNSPRTEQTQQNEDDFAITQRELQEARRAAPVQPPPVQRVISANMVLIASGSFEMVTILDEQDPDENVDIRYVTVNSFYIAKYEVTQREYENVMGYNPSYFKGPNLPVENVSWFDAIEYCNALSRREGLTLAYTITGAGSRRIVTWDKNANGYRLPTEEEWVYACRANTTTPYNTGNTINRNMANYFSRRTVNVGSYAPNRWGLYDMHGNVYEWCWNSSVNSNSENETRIIRGGSWLNTPKRLRSSFRDFYSPYQRTMTIGFRVVQNY